MASNLVGHLNLKQRGYQRDEGCVNQVFILKTKKNPLLKFKVASEILPGTLIDIVCPPNQEKILYRHFGLTLH